MNKNLSVIILVFLFLGGDLVSQAADPIVIFFGGVDSTEAKLSCLKNQNIRTVSASNSGTWQTVAKEINSHPEQKYILAGHSSGSTGAQRTASRVKNTQQVKLVLLDGYAFSTIGSKVRTECWYAENGRGSRSLNAASMLNEREVCSRESRRTFRQEKCKTQYCLHYSLINSNAPSDLTENNHSSAGFGNCKPNLEWAKW